jgi:predicted DsbA family dithiol-disulfide isomerase
MRTALILAFVLLFFLSCHTPDDNNMQKNIIAKVNNEAIFQEEVDSLLSEFLYLIREQALHKIIDEKIICQEAKKLMVTREEYLFKHDNVIKNYGIKMLLDSLREVYTIEIKLKPEFFNTMHNSDKLTVNLLSKGTGSINVYLVKDYKCHFCKTALREIDDIIKKYPSVNFYFVFHSDYIDATALIAMACDSQEKFLDFFYWVYSDMNAYLEKDELIKYALGLDLNYTQFIEDLNDESTIAELIKTREILVNNGIDKVPCFIVNEKILIEGNPLSYLQNVIDYEIKNGN